MKGSLDHLTLITAPSGISGLFHGAFAEQLTQESQEGALGAADTVPQSLQPSPVEIFQFGQ